jgi:MFS family permease
VPASSPNLFRHPDFAKLWTASTISLFGTQVSLIAIPVIAVLFLRVPPFQVALLGTLEFLPFLLFTLPAGVWVDRLPRRRILIAGDLGRAALLSSIPIAYALGFLTIWQLYAVAFANGVLTVFFDIADQSYLPTVVERDQLVEANAKLQGSVSTAQVIGQPLGGGIVGLLTAPFAVALDALSYVVSAALILAIRREERATRASPVAAGAAALEAADAPVSGSSLAAETAAASRHGGHEEDRGVGREVVAGVNLGLTPETVGFIGGGFGAGALAGAVTATRIAARFGAGPAIVGSVVLGTPSALLIPLASHDTALLLIGTAGFIVSWAGVVFNVNQISLRQAITPEPMLGRMNATMRFIVWGTIPIGQILGGLIATAFGTITAIWVGAIGEVFVFLPVFLSPVRTLSRIPDAESD